MSLEEAIQPETKEPEFSEKNNIPTESAVIKVPEAQKDVSTGYRVFNESMSENIGKLAGALALAQGMMSNGIKGKQGYGYKYMELGILVDIARPALTTNGLAVIQTHELIKGTAPSVVTHTTIMHESDQWHKSSIEIPIKIMPNLSQAQMVGVCATYGRRYSLQALCLVASEDDTDGK